MCAIPLLVCYSLAGILCSAVCSAYSFQNSTTQAVPPPHTTEWDLPLPYQTTTVTGAVIMMNASLVTQYTGEKDKDKVIVDILGQGPVPWSIARFDRGDFSPRLQPRRPFAQPNLGIPGNPIGGFFTSDPLNFAVQAWRPTLDKGVLLASVAQNGQQWNDGTPRFYGTVACVTHSEGYGYSMRDGTFGNEDPNIDVTVGKAGALEEGNIDVSIAWFPYDQGWTAGYIDQPTTNVSEHPSWQAHGSHSPNLPEDASKIVTWRKRTYRKHVFKGYTLQLPGVTAAMDGMLFVTSSDPSKENDKVNTIGLYSMGWISSWGIQQREDSSDDVRAVADSSQLMFGFVFIPWTAGGLIGGIIEGSNGKVLIGRGGFKLKRLQEGQYEITVRGPQGDYVTQQDGMLLLQVSGRDDDNRHYSKNAFLSYNYTVDGTLIVESHHLLRDAAGNEEFPLTDTDFSFVWVDFKNPLTPDSNPTSKSFSQRGARGFPWFAFWYTILSIIAAVLVGGVVWSVVQSRIQDVRNSLFWRFQRNDEEFAAELGTDLLHSNASGD